ncbi:hypothetical protein VPH35_140465 [Triticum aestivum]
MCIPKKNGGLRFRDLHSFNLALLAKQCWRLLQNPDSLCARVLSAKYYPDGKILNAGPKKGSSFTWQSIVSGIQTFKRGHIWRVGTGSHIDIWDDPWIPTSENRKVITPRGQAMVDKVEDLIDPISGQWDEDILRSVLSPVDVHRILQIPLRVEVMDNFVAWQHTRSGTFSVRSAYHVEFDHQFGHNWNQRGGPGGFQDCDSWRKVWELSLPGKIKHFVWKVLRGVLPCLGTLAGRHVPANPQCPSCRIGYEDSQHCLFTCKRALDVWSNLGLREDIQRAVMEDRSGAITMDILMRRHELVGEFPMAELVAVASWELPEQFCRDDQGEFIGAASWFVSHVQSAETSEIVAIRNGLYLAAKLGCNSVIVESDSLNAIEAYNQDDYLGPDEAVVAEGKTIGEDLAKFDVAHCFREANGVADSIAKHSLCNSSTEY